MQSLKKSLKAMLEEPGDLQSKLLQYLIQQRRTKHSLTGASPAELLLRRRYRTRLDLLHDNRIEQIRE